jgi:tRNA pseudouridine38-40 synthase
VNYFYKLVLEYKGTRYLGWQVQAESAGLTVQGELNRALKIISKSDSVKSMGAGRTDAGVHALGQVAKVEIPLLIPPESLMKALNGNLPEDIRILSCENSDQEFFPTVHAQSKEYHYRFTANRTSTALQGDFISNTPFELDLEKMRDACKILVGKHDFTNFYCEGTEVASNIREIFECEILEIGQDHWMLPPHLVFRIVGNGFLKQMVRLLMGAIWNVGRGKITLKDLENSLGPTKVQRLGPVAPPNGLYMVRVNY